MIASVVRASSSLSAAQAEPKKTENICVNREGKQSLKSNLSASLAEDDV